MTETAESDDLGRRRVRVRERELLLAFEQWGPAYQNVAGDALRYVFEIAEATEAEQSWLREHVARNGGVPKTARTAEELRALGGQANAAAGAAFLAGEYDRARDLIDDARAYGTLFDGEWVRLHRFIAARSAGQEAVRSAAGTGTSRPDSNEPARADSAEPARADSAEPARADSKETARSGSKETTPVVTPAEPPAPASAT
ncbi:hypothetical protein GCM10010172_81250 [Paractinoplanes ferrugineus]|uniref:Uncharacterized protein n=1 Tax=Paractinoplanes ferrugineus TaxID=113564 RepID=A0A919J4I2_9ACTN|nr:hypothetical protein [Actinoplanes ferrugineus]GIE10446.1 hypothetical protein Afe05nite_22860 [Actinoplanes ferrugineus]